MSKKDNMDRLYDNLFTAKVLECQVLKQLEEKMYKYNSMWPWCGETEQCGREIDNLIEELQIVRIWLINARKAVQG